MWPSLITGGLGLIGSIFGANQSEANTSQMIAGQQAMQANTQQFEERMSNTAYQRASADMTKAGLNPAAMFGSGSAASTPSVGTPSMPNVQTRSPFESLGKIAQDAVGTAVQAKTMDKMADEMANLETENTRLRKVTDLVGQQTAKTTAETEETKARTANIDQDTTRLKLDRARQEWDAIKYLDLSSIPDAARKLGNVGAWGGQKAMDVIAPLSSTARSVRALLPTRSTGQRSGVDSSGKSFDEFWENRTGWSR